MKLSKRQNENGALVREKKTYTVPEALDVLKKAKSVKFDPSVELQFNLGVNAKESDQAVRGTVTLPHGTGKKLRVIVISKDEAGKAALKAGADQVGGAELVDKIAGGWLDFDVVIAAPQMMREVGKLGKILGPRGLMPSPKAGTVTDNLGQAVEQVKKGRIEFKMDKQANIHCMIGKLSFADKALVENAQSLVAAVNSSKPKAVKGALISSLHVSSTMGPGVKIDPGVYKVKEKSDE